MEQGQIFTAAGIEAAQQIDEARSGLDGAMEQFCDRPDGSGARSLLASARFYRRAVVRYRRMMTPLERRFLARLDAGDLAVDEPMPYWADRVLPPHFQAMRLLHLKEQRNAAPGRLEIVG